MVSYWISRLLEILRVINASWHPALRFLPQANLSEPASIILFLNRTLLLTSTLRKHLTPYFILLIPLGPAMDVSYASKLEI